MLSKNLRLVLVFTLSLFFLAACATTSEPSAESSEHEAEDRPKLTRIRRQPPRSADPAPAPKAPMPRESRDAEPPKAIVQLNTLETINTVQSKLGLVGALAELGHTEKSFNPCTLGVSETECRPHYFNAIRFRAQCRDSEGTVESVSLAELKPLHRGDLTWRVGSFHGDMQTNSEGYGEIRFIAPDVSSAKRFILVGGQDSLGLRVSEVRRFMLPRNWCAN